MQPNRLSPADGVQWFGEAKHWDTVPHEAEWKCSERYLATVKGKITFAVLVFSDGATPSFCWRVLSPAPAAPWRVADVLTHEPGVVRPIAARKTFRMPEPFCGSIAAMVALLPPELPGIWFHAVIVQV